MVQINSFCINEKKLVTLDSTTVDKTVESAIEVIKKELPEEAHTVEVMELIIEEMEKSIKASKVLL